MNPYKYFGVDKFVRGVKIIEETGGIAHTFNKLWRFDTLKSGTLVGTDEFGNSYFENNRYFFGRNRWVEYAPHVGFHYDASQIPPKWYGWLHYKTDLLPHEDEARPNYPWILEACENVTGTREAYAPYSTVPPKIKQWTPKSRQRT